MLSAWRRVSRDPNQVRETGDLFLREILPAIGEHHDVAEQLGVAAYRLQRALEIGTTVPGLGEPQGVTRLQDLRNDFIREVAAIDVKILDEYGYTGQEPDEQILVDPDDGELDKLLDEIRDLDERQAWSLVDWHGPDGYLRRIKDIEDEAERVEEWTKAGEKVAATASRIARNGGRNAQQAMRTRDRKALGYARVCSQEHDQLGPCHFCAMLMSREYTYDSERSAAGASGRRGTRRDGERYHDNCDCVAVPIWSEEQWKDPQFDLNRHYSKQWGTVTKGLTGKKAISAWRSYINQTRRDPGGTPFPAQEA